MKNLFIDLRCSWFDLWLKIESWLVKTRWLIRSKPPWNLWVGKDKFRGPLNWNSNAMLSMNHKQRIAYTDDFHGRRRIAHERDLERDLDST